MKLIKTDRKKKIDSIVIKEVEKRSKLIEGRNNGMGFAFLKKVDSNVFETVQPVSPCKDYLNEVIITENTGIGTRAHGLNYKEKLDIFSDVGYMTIKILPDNSGKYYYNKSKLAEEDIKILSDNYKNLENFINQIEKDLDFTDFTKIEKANDEYYLVIVPKQWLISTHAISLYTLLLRIGFVYNGKDNYNEYLSKYEYSLADKRMFESIKNKFKLILQNKKLPPNRIKYSLSALKRGNHSPHNNGIVGWDSSFEEVILSK